MRDTCHAYIVHASSHQTSGSLELWESNHLIKLKKSGVQMKIKYLLVKNLNNAIRSPIIKNNPNHNFFFVYFYKIACRLFVSYIII